MARSHESSAITKRALHSVEYASYDEEEEILSSVAEEPEEAEERDWGTLFDIDIDPCFPRKKALANWNSLLALPPIGPGASQIVLQDPNIFGRAVLNSASSNLFYGGAGVEEGAARLSRVEEGLAGVEKVTGELRSVTNELKELSLANQKALADILGRMDSFATKPTPACAPQKQERAMTKSEKAIRWIAANHEEVCKHAGQLIAVDPATGIVDFDSDLRALSKRLRESGKIKDVVIDSVPELPEESHK